MPSGEFPDLEAALWASSRFGWPPFPLLWLSQTAGEGIIFSVMHSYSGALLMVCGADALVRKTEAWKSAEKLNLVRKCALDALQSAIVLFEDCAALAGQLKTNGQPFYPSKVMAAAAGELGRLSKDFEGRWPEVTEANFEQVLADNYDRWIGVELPLKEAELDAAMERVRRGEAIDLRDVIRELQGSH